MTSKAIQPKGCESKRSQPCGSQQKKSQSKVDQPKGPQPRGSEAKRSQSKGSQSKGSKFKESERKESQSVQSDHTIEANDTMPTLNGAQTMMTLHEKIQHAFFSHSTLKETFNVLCTSTHPYQTDTIISIVTHLCISEIQIKFTDQGFVPFQNCPLLVVPYSCMTKQQILVIKQIVSEIETSPTQFKVSSMMGGGVSITCFETPAHIIDPVDVLFTLYCLLEKHCLKSKTNHQMIYNTIVQRLVCNVNLSHVHIQKACDKIKARTHDQSM